ncbi:unnamed protein product [Victoria cruziana]
MILTFQSEFIDQIDFILISRNGIISQNILIVVSFDMQFHYILAGWEGSATDSRILYSVLDHISDPFVALQGAILI